MFTVLAGCSVSGTNKSDSAKYIGKLDRDITWDKGKRFAIRDNNYKIVTDKKGRRVVLLVENVSQGPINYNIGTPIDKDGCVTPETGNFAEVNEYPMALVTIHKRKLGFKPSTFCFKVRKLGE